MTRFIRCSLLLASRVACVVLLVRRLPAQASSAGAMPDPKATALADIVGVWQSDTTGGVSARSTCVWTPDHLAVICDQKISRPGGADYATNVYAVNNGAHAAASSFVFYAVPRDGSVIRPLALTIANHTWIYGGGARSDDGRYYRTVNDFSASDSYTWRQESSTDGVQWTAGAHGRSMRVSAANR